jgi:hypothetical protein
MRTFLFYTFPTARWVAEFRLPIPFLERKKTMSNNQNGTELPQKMLLSPKRYMNTGPQITERLETFFAILGQQGVLRFDHAQCFLGRMTPEPGKMKQPGILSAERTRKILRPWLKEEVISYRTFFNRQKGCIWLTAKGIKYANLHLRYYEPNPATLSHLYAVNDVRLLLAERHPKDTWRSEREIRAQQNVNVKDSTPLHVPDAELISANGNSVIGIECVLTVRSEKRLEEIVFNLAGNKRYSAIWYFSPEPVYTAVKKAVNKLPAEHRKRFFFYTLQGESYTA